MSSVQPCPTPLVLQNGGAADTGLAPCHWVLTRWVSPHCHPRYFEEIFNASGTPELVKKYGDWFTYDKNPRAQIFRRNQTLVRDLDSMVRLMRWVLATSSKTWVSPTPPQGSATLRGDFVVINFFFPRFHHSLDHVAGPTTTCRTRCRGARAATPPRTPRTPSPPAPTSTPPTAPTLSPPCASAATAAPT